MPSRGTKRHAESSFACDSGDEPDEYPGAFEWPPGAEAGESESRASDAEVDCDSDSESHVHAVPLKSLYCNGDLRTVSLLLFDDNSLLIHPNLVLVPEERFCHAPKPRRYGKLACEALELRL